MVKSEAVWQSSKVSVGGFGEADRLKVEASFLKNPQVADFHKKYGNFRYSLKPDRVELISEKTPSITQTVLLASRAVYDSALKRARDYACLSEPLSQDVAKAQDIALKEVSKPATIEAGVSTGVALVGSGANIARHGVEIHSGENHRFVTVTALPVGVLWWISAYFEFRQGAAEIDRSTLIGDGEGYRRGTLAALSGGVNLAGSLGYVASKVASFAPVVGGIAASGMSTIADSFFGIGAVLALGTSAVSVYRCWKFRQRLDRALDGASDRREALQRGISFLLSRSTVMPDEERAIEAEASLNGKGIDWISQKKAKLAETKLKYFKRRTSVVASKKIHEEAQNTANGKGLIDRLKNPRDEAAVNEAEKLLSDVQEANAKKTGLFVLIFVLALIGLVGLILGTFFSCGILPLVLYIIASAASFLLTGYNVVQQVFGSSGDALSSQIGPVLEHSNIP